MMTAELPQRPPKPAKAKRRYRPFWLRSPDKWPMCPKCGVVCPVIPGGSKPTVDANGNAGSQVQYRRCPQCGKAVKTSVPLGGATDNTTSGETESPQ